MEQSLVIIKPDAVQRGLAGTIISRLERQGLKIVAMKMLHMDKALAQRHYAIHRGKPFFEDLVEFITSSPVIAIIFEGKRAIEVVRQTMGATDPRQASPGTIRGDFGLNIQHNLIHGSDSTETAKQEISLFFTPQEIFNYRLGIDKRTGGD